MDDFWANGEDPAVDTRGTNNPPEEAKILNLATAEDIPTMVKADVEELKESIKALLAIAARAPADIENDDIYNRFTALVGKLKDAQEDRETRKKKIKDPYNKASTAIENAFKLIDDQDGEKVDLRKMLDDTFEAFKKRMSAYDTKKYLAEEAERQAEHDRLAQSAAEDGITLDASAIAPVKMGSQKSEHGGTSVRSVVDTWEVIDESLLPRSVLSIDKAKVDQLIADGAKEIPGIKISKAVSTSVRRR